MTGLLVAGLALLAAAAAAELLLGVSRPRARSAPYLLVLAGCACLTVVGVLGVLGHRLVIGADVLDLGRPLFTLDPLSGLFLTGMATVGGLLSLVFVSWIAPAGRVGGRGLCTGFALLMFAVATVVLAENAFVFLFGYELVTLSFYVLTSIDRHQQEPVPGSFLAVVFGKLSGALVLLGFLLLAGSSRSIAFSAWTQVPPGAVHDGAYALIVAGFGAKVGLIPLQVWMPAGYAAAAGPARAAMSAIAMNVGLYGLWRTLSVLGAPPVWLVVVLLVTASATALVGVAHAAVNSDLHRVIAFSSVENGGLILTGFGVALAGASAGDERLVALGLLAATLQATTHAFAKAALFGGAATISSVYGTSSLDLLRGAARRLPSSGTAFAIGAVSLAGLPPTLGFASEWFLLEALLNQFRIHGLALHLAMATAGALLALTAGFAALVFLRLFGLTILGSTAKTPRERDVGWAGRIGLAGLAFLCLALAAVAPLLIRFLAAGLSPVVPAAVTRGALSSPWVLTSVYADFSVLSPSWLWITLPIGMAAVAAFVVVVTRGSYLRVRRVPAWHSASPGVAGPERFTAFAFATPTRHVLANVLPGRHTRAPADRGDANGPVLTYRTDVIEITGRYLYRPIVAAALGLARAVKLLQAGRLDAYIAYVFIAFVAVFTIAVGLG